MINLVKSVLSYKTVSRVFELYRTLPNIVKLEQNNEIIDRHTIGVIGKFLLSKFSKEEFAFVWEEVKPVLEQELNSDVELVYARILKYNAGCLIPRHLDTFTEANSDISVIIQITDPATYKGGEMIVGNQLMNLEVGDMVFYTYDVEHEVKPVKDGIRYVINLRCKNVK